MPKPKSEVKPVPKKDESNPLVDNINVENEVKEGVEDSPEAKPEGNQPNPPKKEAELPESEGKKPDVKDSDEGQPVEVKPEAKQDDVAAAISKANEKTSRELDLVASLLKDNPEKLQELQEKEPKLFEKLQRRLPDLVIQKEEEKEPAEKASKLSEMLKVLVRKDEERDFEDWRQSNAISDADYKERKDSLEDNARTLFEEGVVKDWNQAIHFAGKIVFPHLDTKPVDNSRLSKLRGQSSSSSKVTPPKSGFSDEDYAVMKREKMTEDEYRKVQSDEIFAPGIV